MILGNIDAGLTNNKEHDRAILPQCHVVSHVG